MGFWDKLFNRDSAYYIKKSDESIEMDDLGYADECLKKAEELADEDDEKVLKEIEEKRKNLKKLCYERAFKQAKRLLRAGNRGAAQTAIDRAARFVQNDEEREALNALVEGSYHEKEEEKIVEAHVDGEEKVTGLSSNDKYNLYVTQLPFAKAQHFDELGDDFKNAWVLLQEGQFDDAIKGLEEVYEKHGDDALVMCELGRAYYGKGEFARASELLDKSDKSDPETETKLLHAEVLWAMKDFEQAESVLQAAYDNDPENDSVLAMIANHGLRSGDFESGIDAIEELIRKHPRDFSVYRLAGRLYLAAGKEEKALESFEMVNHLFWQVNPQTKQLTFDQNSAVAAANLYVKLDKKLDRAAELLEAVRASTKGETHIAICLQLAEVYEKMEKDSKRIEVLNESTRFLDEQLDTATGPERAMLNLQYSDICEQLGDSDKQKELIEEARLFFMKDAANGHPVASFYLYLIENKLAGKPFPKADEMQDEMLKFVKEHQAELQQKAAGPMSRMPEAPVSQEVKQVAPKITQKEADDIIARMSAMALPTVKPRVVEMSDSEEDEEVEAAEEAEAAEEIEASEESEVSEDSEEEKNEKIEE